MKMTQPFAVEQTIKVGSGIYRAAEEYSWGFRNVVLYELAPDSLFGEAWVCRYVGRDEQDCESWLEKYA